MKSWKDDQRAATNPVFGPHKLKMGSFGLNSGGQIMTLAPDHYSADWAIADRAMAKQAELGLDLQVGIVNYSSPELDPFTWATALMARHDTGAAFSTQHVQLMHPVMCARLGATADIISGGRWGLNMVAGSNPVTFAAFGRAMQSHEDRYANAEEFVTLLKRLWIEQGPVSFDGRFFQCHNVKIEPHPIQSIPPLMNAGMSGRGRDFACKHADMVFTLLEPDFADAKVQIAEYRRIARDDFGRDVQIWTHGYFVIRDTEQEAQDFLDYYTKQHGDHENIEKWVAMNTASQAGVTDPERVARLHQGWAAGSGTRMVGTADQVAERLKQLSDIGLDGILMNSIEPLRMLERFGRDVLPRIEAMGLRERSAVAREPVAA